jgi:D-xylose transport system permease protein
MIAAIVVIMLFFTWVTDGAYLSARNISNLLRQTAITGILAVGMVFVIISAEIDLSVGSMMGLLGGAAAIFDVWLGWPLPLTILVTLVMGLLLGVERMVGSLSQGALVYRHPRRDAGVSRHSDRHHQRDHRLAHQPGDVADRPKLSARWHRLRHRRCRHGGVYRLAVARRMRRQALGLATASSAVGRQAITAVIVLGAIWLLNDYRGVPTR